MKREKNYIKILTAGCASWSAFPHSPWVASLPHSFTEPQRPHSLGDSARQEEEEDEDEENNEEEEEGEEEAFNPLLNYWFHRDWGWKVLLASFFPIASTVPELFILQPLCSQSCVSQSPSMVHHCYFLRLPSKPVLAYGWKEMFPKSSCSSLNTPWTLPAIKETFIVIISPTLKYTRINLLGLGSLFFSFLTTSVELLKKEQSFICSFNFLQCSLFYRVLC